MTRIAFIGVGNMGLPMLRNLRAAGHEVRAYDVSPAALAEAVAAGAVAAASLADAVTGAEVVITMLPEGRHVRAAYLGDGGNDGIIGHASTEALLADCSTIDIASAREVAAAAGAAGYQMIDAPVSGGVSGAAAGTLTFMVGGSAAGFARAEPILSAMGRNVVHVGEPGHGQAAKICNNMMAGIAIIGASEVACLGEALGLDAKTLYGVLSTSSGQTWMMDHMYPVPGIVDIAASNRNFAPGFKAALMSKDLGLAQSAAADTGTSTPLGAGAAALFRMLCHNGAGELDCSAVYKLLHGDL
ncbi:MAG: 3-hydroxyisobutyrate dehydrogenase [Thiotrichales bacterium]|nr:3-hydroxyisobutyrate dehydrogenase [Thiotrichales bacterium]